MTSKELHDALEQNRENLKALLNELDADYEYPVEPEKKARMAAHFGDSEERVKEAEMDDTERIAWMFEQNAKAIAAVAEAAGVSERKLDRSANGGSLQNAIDSGFFTPHKAR